MEHIYFTTKLVSKEISTLIKQVDRLQSTTPLIDDGLIHFPRSTNRNKKKSSVQINARRLRNGIAARAKQATGTKEQQPVQVAASSWGPKIQPQRFPVMHAYPVLEECLSLSSSPSSFIKGGRWPWRLQREAGLLLAWYFLHQAKLLPRLQLFASSCSCLFFARVCYNQQLTDQWGGNRAATRWG